MFSRNNNEVSHLDIYNRLTFLETHLESIDRDLGEDRKQLKIIADKLAAYDVTNGVSRAAGWFAALLAPMCLGGLFWIYGQVIRLEEQLVNRNPNITYINTYGTRSHHLSPD